MLFNTWTFVLFYAIVWAAYVRLNHAWQNRLLLAASYFFYGMWDWRFCSLLLISSVVDYQVGQRMAATNDRLRRRVLLLVSLATNLGILGFFKYFNFFTESAVELLGSMGFAVHQPTLNIILPVGISFYTFQTLSYTIDIYRNQLQPVRDKVAFGVYVAYFPQLVAGPIERATRLLPQIENRRTVTAENLASGGLLILIGMVRKVTIADNMAPFVEEFFSSPGSYSGPALVLGTLMFALQIYGDFAGYSDIARGVSRTFGIELMENFRQPYFSTSISEFWRRWHISLSTWLRDYLYIPLGGNRGSTIFVYRNLMLTMLLGGLWHGAAWTFVVWGGIHGLALIVHKAWDSAWADRPANPLRERLLTPIYWALTLSVVLLAWVFFRAPDFATAWEFLSGIASWRTGGESIRSALLAFSGCLILILVIDLPQVLSRNQTVMLRWPVLLRAPAYAALLLVLNTFRPQHDVPFIYFQF